MKKYKVSVIVAIYNVDRFIEKCILSIINQDYKNIEIILVDDCSSDNSGIICDKYSNQDERIKVLHHYENMRHSVVRNHGIELATGDYITFVDGDDWLAPDYVSYLLEKAIETKADMVINLNNFTSRDNVQVDKEICEIWSSEKATAELLYPHLTVGCWNKIYKKEFIDRNHLRFNPVFFTGEGDCFINAASQCANYVGVVNRKVYYYRLNNVNSATTKCDIRQSLGSLEVMNDIENNLVIKTPYVMRALRQHRWLNHLWHIRQVLELNEKEKYHSSYLSSIKYVKSNFLLVVLDEPNFEKKVKYFIYGLFPIYSSKILNDRFKKRLSNDIKNNANETVE